MIQSPTNVSSTRIKQIVNLAEGISKQEGKIEQPKQAYFSPSLVAEHTVIDNSTKLLPVGRVNPHQFENGTQVDDNNDTLAVQPTGNVKGQSVATENTSSVATKIVTWLRGLFA